MSIQNTHLNQKKDFPNPNYKEDLSKDQYPQQIDPNLITPYTVDQHTSINYENLHAQTPENPNQIAFTDLTAKDFKLAKNNSQSKITIFFKNKKTKKITTLIANSCLAINTTAMCISALSIIFLAISTAAISLIVLNKFIRKCKIKKASYMPKIMPKEMPEIAIQKFKQIKDVAQYGRADWKNLIETKRGISLDEAKAIASSNPNIKYFFYTKGPGMTLVHNDIVRHFSRGDAVFFSGQPW